MPDMTLAFHFINKTYHFPPFKDLVTISTWQQFQITHSPLLSRRERPTITNFYIRPPYTHHIWFNPHMASLDHESSHKASQHQFNEYTQSWTLPTHACILAHICIPINLHKNLIVPTHISILLCSYIQVSSHHAHTWASQKCACLWNLLDLNPLDSM